MISYKGLIIIGTSHIARQSIQEVRDELARKPDIVAIELDRNRLSGLLSQGRTRINLLDIFRVGLLGFIFVLIGSWAQKKLGRFVGVMPGTEMLTAFRLAKKNNAQVALIDQDIMITLRRLSRTVTWKEKLRVPFDIIKTALFSKSELRRLGIEEFDLTRVPSQEVIKKLMAGLKKDYPNVYNVLVAERNRFMARNLAALMASNPEKKIIAVVGAGHEEEILDLVKKSSGAGAAGVTYEFTVKQPDK